MPCFSCFSTFLFASAPYLTSYYDFSQLLTVKTEWQSNRRLTSLQIILNITTRLNWIIMASEKQLQMHWSNRSHYIHQCVPLKSSLINCLFILVWRGCIKGALGATYIGQHRRPAVLLCCVDMAAWKPQEQTRTWQRNTYSQVWINTKSYLITTVL